MADRNGAEVPDSIKHALEERRFADAAAALEPVVASAPSGEAFAFLALAEFQLERYGEAAKHYEAALEYAPDNDQWREMHRLASANALSEVNVYVPEPTFFVKEKLLAAPDLAPGTLPLPPQPRKQGFVKHWRLKVEHKLGAIVTFIMDTLTALTGRVLGYRDRVWTNWYHRRFTIAVLTLAYMRNRLNRNNLKNTYPPGRLVGFQAEGQAPPPGVTHFRTANGTWNNLSNPKEGAAGTRFPRNVNNQAIRPETGEALMTPNPREISVKLLAREGPMKQVPFLNMLAASWINFQNHDWVHHGDIVMNDVHEVPLPQDDPARTKYQQTAMYIGKTQPDPTRQSAGEPAPVTFINDVTHWWDGSQIYGSDEATLGKIRSGVDGKLKVTEDGLLPLDEKGIELTGFTRNWWIGLTMLHTVFTREHNAICDQLKQSYPDWDDKRLFNVARLINAAVMAKIHTVEWTPAILPNRTLDSALNSNWYGLLTNLLRTGSERRTRADINIRNPEMGGVVGNPLDRHGQPYGLTEEFVEVYRLHSLIPENIEIRRTNELDVSEEIPFSATRQAASGKITQRIPMRDLFYSFGVQHPGQLILNNFPTSMRELSIPGNPLFDMAVVDILRPRERGVPRYNEFRRQLGLNPIESFDDLTDDKEVVAKIREVYGDQPGDVEKLDLMIGTLAEGHRPTGFGFGETLFQIFILNATRRLQADRFYTDYYNEEVYTPEGLSWIDATDLKTVILRHYPELENTGLGNIKNAFEPWDTGERLDPSRHPLREWDRELRPDPWVGDAHRAR